MTLFNIWHYIVVAVLLAVYVLVILAARKQESKKVKITIITAMTAVLMIIGTVSILAVDKYTKKVELYKFDNKRLLSIEKIVYTGIVKNEGNYPIGEVTLEVKIVNKARQMGARASFFTPSGFAEFFGGGANILYRPQHIVKKFVVATNLQPGQAKSFRVHFDYPPYFKNVSQFADVYGH
jgi:tRNA G10  N-methylase Trm11